MYDPEKKHESWVSGNPYFISSIEAENLESPLLLNGHPRLIGHVTDEAGTAITTFAYKDEVRKVHTFG